jgi:hypothetical protein
MATNAEVLVRKRNSAGATPIIATRVITARWGRRRPARSVVSRRSPLLGLNLNRVQLTRQTFKCWLRNPLFGAPDFIREVGETDPAHPLKLPRVHGIS